MSSTPTGLTPVKSADIHIRVADQGFGRPLKGLPVEGTYQRTYQPIAGGKDYRQLRPKPWVGARSDARKFRVADSDQKEDQGGILARPGR